MNDFPVEANGQTIRVCRANNDVNGNPRYVIHYLDLFTSVELAEIYAADCKAGKTFENRTDKYAIACKRGNELLGSRKFHNKQYGGGVVFSSYSVEDDLAYMLKTIHAASVANIISLTSTK